MWRKRAYSWLCSHTPDESLYNIYQNAFICSQQVKKQNKTIFFLTVNLIWGVEVLTSYYQINVLKCVSFVWIWQLCDADLISLQLGSDTTGSGCFFSQISLCSLITPKLTQNGTCAYICIYAHLQILASSSRGPNQADIPPLIFFQEEACCIWLYKVRLERLVGRRGGGRFII